MATRKKKTIISGVTREAAEAAFGQYAKADAQINKINAEIELACAKIREKHAFIKSCSKLLETMVQLLVLQPDGNGSYVSRSLSIDELAGLIRSRYGLVINGVDEPRFENADVETHAAFKENMDALKNKLRQIGFYTDMSDACLLQKIRPRY